MVQGVQRVPGAERVGEAVTPVIGKVQDEGVDEEGDERMPEQSRDQDLQIGRDEPGIDDAGGEPGLDLVEQHEADDGDEPDAREQGVENVDADGLAVGPAFHREGGLQRPADGVGEEDGEQPVDADECPVEGQLLPPHPTETVQDGQDGILVGIAGEGAEETIHVGLRS
jgi:hypothetical protein